MKTGMHWRHPNGLYSRAICLHGQHLALLKENSTLKCSHNNHQPKMLGIFCDQALQITLFGALLNQSYLPGRHFNPPKYFFQ